MIKHKQLIKHEPELGQYGDCFRTCIASLLHLTPDQVPHFLWDNPTPEVFWERIRVWLKSQGFLIFSVAFSTSLEEILEYMKQANPDIYYLIAGTSDRGTNHQVIGLNDQIVHDPHEDNCGLNGPCDDGLYWVEVLLPYSVHGNEWSKKAQYD